jgi:hypothetical protein
MKNRVGKSKKTNKQINNNNNNTRTGAKASSLSNTASCQQQNQLPLLSKSDPPKLKLTGKERTKLQGENAGNKD